jgi:proteasome lid subunit RPN8/RPN11
MMSTISGGFGVKSTHQALASIRLHAKSGGREEIIGLLLGTLREDGTLLVEHAIAAEGAKQSQAQVTLTAEAWANALGTIDRDHAGATIVGWYHSHPGHGVFLSEPDLFVHRSFFDLPWQTAVVIDPTTGQCDAFWFDAQGGLVQKPLEAVDEGGSRSRGKSKLLVEAMVWFIGAYVVTLLLLRLSQTTFMNTR